jgi:hypothetical protein
VGDSVQRTDKIKNTIDYTSFRFNPDLLYTANINGNDAAAKNGSVANQEDCGC